MRGKAIGKRFLAAFLCFLMALSLLPGLAMAAVEGSPEPTAEGTPEPTAEGTPEPTAEGTPEPTAEGTPEPTAEGTPEPTAEGTPEPTVETTPIPTVELTTPPTPELSPIASPSPAIAVLELDAAADPYAGAFQYKILHLDCGRKYFSKDWIIALIQEMSAAGYTQLQLAFGNDGLRFLLDDMSVLTYSSDAVKSAIIAGNDSYYNDPDYEDPAGNHLTQSEMDEIIAAAKGAGIEIVPLLNTPGHMDAIVDAISALCGVNGYNGSGRSINITNSTAVNFTQELVRKYAAYFAGKGCKYFNIGADEFANDIYTSGGMGFGHLTSSGLYSDFVDYVNGLADIVKAEGMTPRAFNDGLYYGGSTLAFDTSIEVCYWSSGWSGYSVASASAIAAKGHPMINTHGDYYYVLGKNDNFDSGYSYASNFSNSVFMGSTISNPIGSMFCIWCDYPGAETEAQIAAKVRMPLRAMAAAMGGTSYSAEDVIVPGGFNADGKINGAEEETGTITVPTAKDEVTTVVPQPTKDGASYSVTAKARDTVQLTVNLTPTEGTNELTWISNNEIIAAVANGLVTFTGAAGTVTITATLTALTNSNTKSISATGDSASLTFEVTAGEAGGGTLPDVPAYVAGTLSTGTNPATTTYVLDTDGVEAGGVYLIVGANNDFALYQSGGTLGAQSVTISGNTASIAANESGATWTFSGRSSGAISNGGYALRRTSNILTTINGTGTSWTISNQGSGSYRIYNSSRYIRYNNGSFGLIQSYSNQPTVRLYKQTSTPGSSTYAVSADYISTLLTYARKLTAADYYNWEDLGMDDLIAAAQAAVDGIANPYSDQAAAQTQQEAVNAAAENLHNALTQLSTAPTYRVTVYTKDAEGKEIGGDEGTPGVYAYQLPAGEQSLTPPAITGYTAPAAQTVTVLEDGSATVTFTYTAKTAYTVSYDWGTENIPQGVTLPASATVYEGDIYTVDATQYGSINAPDGSGVYTFSGWSQTGEISVTGDIILTGSWTFTPGDVYTADTLEIEYWITNGRCTSNGLNYVGISQTDLEVASEAGKATADIVAAQTTKESRQLKYWRTRLLDKELENTSSNGTEEQTETGGDDETLGGIVFTRVRYWNGLWQVYSESGAWLTVMAKHQLVAYYMEQTTIGSEFEVLAADWGKVGDGSTSGDYLTPEMSCSVSIQVVYEDGSTNPGGTGAGDLNSKTLVYNYWENGRGVGTIIFNDLAGYDIWKVTAETGAITNYTGDTWGSYNVNGFSWDSNEKTVWQGDPAGSVTIHNNARTPNSTDPYDNLMWDENHEAILLRVYVRTKTSEENLKVYYRDGSPASYADIYSYQITVGEAAPNSFAAFGTSTDADGNLTLTSNTVVNALGATQTVQYILTGLTEVGPIYSSGLYAFVQMEKSADNKELYLYYRPRLDSYTFVVDYGLPLEIDRASMNFGSIATITDISFGDTATGGVMRFESAFGVFELLTRTAGGNDYYVRYTLKAHQDIHGTDSVVVTAHNNSVQGSSSISTRISIIPATTVYYEDSFFSFVNVNGAAGVSTSEDMGMWRQVGAADADAVQHLDKVGDATANVYGYDQAYEDCAGYSLGSAVMTTVEAATYTDYGRWPEATFTFQGTGFDIISLTDNTSGAIFVDVYSGAVAEGSPVQSITVNNYYGYTYNEDGSWTAEPNTPNALYQVPVIKVSDLSYDQYTVRIRVGYASFLDQTGSGSYSFYLDAIRIYNPAPVIPEYKKAYESDGEAPLYYYEIRNLLLKAADFNLDPDQSVSGILFIDGKGNLQNNGAGVSDYANFGPNNEVYLTSGQGVAFQILYEASADFPQPADMRALNVQIGAKLAAGASAELYVDDAAFKTLTTATDMYYELSANAVTWTAQTAQDGTLTYLSSPIVLSNGGTDTGAILSLTNVKLAGPAVAADSGGEFSLLSTASTARYALSLLAGAPVAEEPDPFRPAVFSASWSASRRQATLTIKTSEDVAALSVDGEQITSYTLRRERTGWGWNAGYTTYKLWTYRLSSPVNGDYMVVAYDAQGLASEPLAATLNSRYYQQAAALGQSSQQAGAQQPSVSLSPVQQQQSGPAANPESGQGAAPSEGAAADSQLKGWIDWLFSWAGGSASGSSQIVDIVLS